MVSQAPALYALIVGCEDEDDAESTCAIAVDLAGDITAKLTNDSSVACLTPFAFDEGFEVGYAPTADGDLDSLELVVDTVTRGQTGAGFTATVRINHQDNSRYAAAGCTVEIETHESRGPVEFGESFRITGKGECPAPATRSDGPGEVTIAPFSFVAVVTWG